jgi:membrane protein
MFTPASAPADDQDFHISDRGRSATSPWGMPLAAWKAVLQRTWAETSEDNMGLVAAGVAFYGFLAIVPMLAALVLIYGLVADGPTVLRDIGHLADLLPPYAAKFLAAQLIEVVQASDGKKGLGLAMAIALALFGARNGAASIITALNIAYEEAETRGFIRQTALALGMTAAAVLLAGIAVLAIAALGHLEALLPTMPDGLIGVGKLVSYLLLALAGAAGAATLYRYGPDRARARWIWLTPGSMFAAVGWLILSLGFGVYVAVVDDYSATYGSLSAIVVMLTWLYLSSYVLLLGAELNSELEHHTIRDTTEGAEKPLGDREAWVADHVAGEASTSPDSRASPMSDAPAEKTEETDSVSPGKDPSPRSALAEYGTIRAVHWSERLVGIAKIGALPSAAAATGLASIRREGGARRGAFLLLLAGGLAWIGRERTER